MHRTQIALPPELHHKATQRASALRISLAEYLRRLLARDLEAPRSDTDVGAIFGLGNSQGSDVARHKHDYLEEAVESEHGDSLARQ